MKKSLKDSIYFHDVNISPYLTLKTLACFYINGLLILNNLTTHTDHKDT